MLWVLAFHIIFLVCWFAGLFYLPRLFVYHAASHDEISLNRFKVMEHKLFYFIMTPSGILATIFGLWLLYFFPVYLHFNWMYVKLAAVILLWIYHIYCGKLLHDFKRDRNRHSVRFYRFFNEIPILLLILIVIMVVVKP
jgi:putative membrane protein